jgi:hypothetical protein
MLVEEGHAGPTGEAGRSLVVLAGQGLGGELEVVARVGIKVVKLRGV